MSTRKPATKPAPWPDWCGNCQRETRRMEHPEDGRDLGICQRCHPKAAKPVQAPGEALPWEAPPGLLSEVAAAVPDLVRLDGQRILATFARSGELFSANELRPYLDQAMVPPAQRGAITAAALKAGVIVEVGSTRSTDPGTHGKRIGVYRGANVPAREPGRCDLCGLPLDPTLLFDEQSTHPACDVQPSAPAP